MNRVHQILNAADYHIRILNEQVTEFTLRNSISQIVPLQNTMHPETVRPETEIAEQLEPPMDLSVR